MLNTIIVTENEGLGSLLRERLEGLQGFVIKAELAKPSLAYELARGSKPDILILDLDAREGKSWLSLAERLLEEDPHITLLVTAKEEDKELILKALRAGAKDFLDQPFQTQELVSIISRVTQRGCLKKEEPQRKGKAIVVFSNKGGTGTTTIASNLAVGLGQLDRCSTALVDLVLQHGDISSFLNIAPPYTIVDVVNNLNRADPTFLENSLTKHPSGIYVLAEPAKPEEADGISNSHITQLLSRLCSSFDYVVIDGGHQFDGRTISALDVADIILVVFVLDLPTIRSTIRCLEVLRRLGYTQEKVKLILNRYNPKDLISLREAEATLGYPIYWKLPNDFNSVISAINQGQPVFDVAKKSELSCALLRLVELISERPGVSAPQAPQKRKICGKILTLLGVSREKQKTPSR